MTLTKLLSGAAALVCVFALASIAPEAVANGGGGGGGSMSSSPPPQPRADPQVAYQAGVTALNAHDYPEAIRQFRTARRALPNDGTINFALGLAYVGNGDKDDAQDAFERAVRDANAPVGARLQLGLVSLELGEREKAVEQQTALSAALAACDAQCGEQRRGQLRTALDQLTRALEAPAAGTQSSADPATTGWTFPSVQEGREAYAVAVGYINQERYVEGLAALERAQAAVGPHADILNYMGFASRHLGRLDSALAYYREALRLDPDHLGANEYLGELYLQMGDIPAARRQLARLDRLCAYGCAQREELAQWIAVASN